MEGTEVEKMRLEIMKGKRWLILVTLLVLLQSVMRLALTQVDSSQLVDMQMTELQAGFIQAMLYGLGIGGIAFAYPFLKGARVGMYGVVGVSLATIAFDIWGMTIQWTAVTGMIVPLLAIAFIAMNRNMFRGGESIEVAGGVWN